MCFFSIVLPTFNRAHLITAPIQSVINQSFKDWELIIIDDGSTDNTKEIAAQFNDSRIKYIYQANMERSMARNNGINNAGGELICFIDSDDSWHSNHLELIYQKAMERHLRPALYFTGMRWISASRSTDVIFDHPQNRNQVEYVIENQIAPSTACLNRSITEQIKFNPALRINEDVEFFARVAAHFDLVQIREITVDFSIHDENTKGLTKNYISPQVEAMKLIFENEELKGKLSGAFKVKIFKGLKHQLINHYSASGEYMLMNKEIVLFLLQFPFNPGNKTKWVLLLYHLPGGQLLKSMVGKLKGESNV